MVDSHGREDEAAHDAVLVGQEKSGGHLEHTELGVEGDPTLPDLEPAVRAGSGRSRLRADPDTACEVEDGRVPLSRDRVDVQRLPQSETRSPSSESPFSVSSRAPVPGAALPTTSRRIASAT